MAATSLFAVLFLLSRVSAVPNVTVTQIYAGNCGGYPSSYSTGGTHADAFNFIPAEADVGSLNGLKTGVKNGNFVVYRYDGFEDNATYSELASDIFCCDVGGHVLNGLGDKMLLLSTNVEVQDLGFYIDGFQPETYEHYLDGVKQDGVFLGLGNVTTWSFRRLAEDIYWKTRLIGPGSKSIDGDYIEFRGFLKAVAPPPP
jgi:hypothetical protein